MIKKCGFTAIMCVMSLGAFAKTISSQASVTIVNSVFSFPTSTRNPGKDKADPLINIGMLPNSTNIVIPENIQPNQIFKYRIEADPQAILDSVQNTNLNFYVELYDAPIVYVKEVPHKLTLVLNGKASNTVPGDVFLNNNKIVSFALIDYNEALDGPLNDDKQKYPGISFSFM